MNSSKIESIGPAPTKSQLFLLNLLKNKKKIGWAFIYAFIISFSVGLCYYKWNKTKTKNYSTLSTPSGHEILSSSHSDLKSLKKAAARYPSLQPQLDPTLAQEYLNLGQLHQAKTHASRIQKRQRPFLQLVDSFNEITFLIEEHQYAQALAKSYELKSKLITQPHLKGLYTVNLVRLVALEQKLQHLEEKKELIAELQDLNAQEYLQLGHLNLIEHLEDKTHF